MSSYIDLQNLVDIQRQFIGSAGDIEDSGAIANLDLGLRELSTALNSAGQSIGPTLTYQSEVKTILDREQSRLDAKKSTIDAAHQKQKRMIDLTNSNTKKNRAVNLILMILVITFLVVLGIKQIYDNGIIPNTVLDIMNIIVIAVGIIYSFVLYANASNRSNMDFDQIIMDQPPRKSQAEIDADRANQLASGKLSDATAGANSGCVGAQCCPAGSTFNEYNRVCVPGKPTTAAATDVAFYNTQSRAISWINPATATTATPPGCGDAGNYDPLKLACKTTTQGFTTMTTSDGVKPYTPCEFSQYNAYNVCGASTM
jgi:hypothetical protein